MKESKKRLLESIKEEYGAENHLEGVIMLLREFSTNALEIRAELKRRGMTKSKAAIQEWCRRGELLCYKIVPGDIRSAWIVWRLAASARINAEESIAAERDVGTRGKRGGQNGRPNTKDLMDKGKL